MSVFERAGGVARVAALGVIAALVAAAAIVLWPQEDQRQLTAYFSRTVSLYEGSDVRVLGVRVGQVDSIEPAGTSVRVDMSYDAEVNVPRSAKAAVVSPAIVGDRFVQLTPAWSGGPTLADGAVLDEERTAVPLELDEIYQSLDDLSVALGPEGANEDGALSRLLEVTAENVDGQGERFNRTINDIGRLSEVLDNNKEELFSSIEQLARFTQTLKRNDENIRKFTRDLARVSEFLDGERDDLSVSLDNLATAMDDITAFVRDNEQLLSENIEGLTEISQTLVKQRDALKESLDVAPLALNNLARAYNPLSGTLDQRMNIDQNVHQLTSDPALVLCGMVRQNDPTGDACEAIKGLVGALPDLPDLPLPRSAPFADQGGGAAGGAAGQDKPRVEVEYIDTTLAGILGEEER